MRVPENWREVFIRDERDEKITAARNDELDRIAAEAFRIKFIQHSEEEEQEYFFGNITSFTSSKLDVKLSFSEPLLVSTGSVPDKVEIKLLKSYFLEPETQRRLLSSNCREMALRREYATL